MERAQIEKIVREVLVESLGNVQSETGKKTLPNGVISFDLPQFAVRPEDRLDTGHAGDHVFCRNLLSLEESPRLGYGMMEMRDTDFAWNLEYDEIDHVIEGELTVKMGDRFVTAKPGESIFIPKGSSIIFSVKGFARFTYTTFPADWENQ